MLDERLLEGLPEETCAKLRRLEADRAAAAAAYHAAADAAQEARTELQLKEGLVSQKLRELGPVAAWSASESERRTAERDAELTAPLEPLRRRLHAALDAQERAAEVRARFAFLERIESWLRDNIGLGRTFRRCAVSPPKAPKGFPAAIDQIRAELRALNERRLEVENAPLPPNELLARAVAEIDALAQRGALRVNPTARGPEPVTSLNEALRIAAVPVPEANGLNIFSPGAGGGTLWVWLHRDALVERVEQMIGELPAKGCLTDEERKARLDEIDGKRLEVERAEEALICLAEQNGQVITRRPDASPIAILEIELA